MFSKTMIALSITFVLGAASAAPALAQAVIDYPGACAQLYPNANCQNLGPGNPYTDGGYWRGSHASVQYDWGRHHRRHQR